jgi:nicotinamide-nucleotide amidase
LYAAGLGFVEVVLMSELTFALADRLTALGWMMATAESCTGGLIAAQCTDLPGSSRWFDRGLVTYSNAAKTELLGVDAALIETHGAVSEVVARAMALGAVYRTCARASVSITGIAGPDGGSDAKPVGTVWFGWCIDGLVYSECQLFTGDRQQVRQASSKHALQGLMQRLPVET